MTSNLVTRFVVIGLVVTLAVLTISLGWPIDLGVDLRGGTVLTYKVEPVDVTGGLSDEDTVQSEDLGATVSVISQRINKEGTKDIQVRSAGDEYIEITMPKATKAEADAVREKMTQIGQLLFPIVANNGDQVGGVTFNRDRLENQRKAALKAGRSFREPEGFRFFPVRPERRERESDADYEARIERYETIRRESPWELSADEGAEYRGQWMYFDPEYWSGRAGRNGFTGEDISDARKTTDEKGGRAITYNVAPSAQADFAGYSKKYIGRLMAVVLNNEVFSSATIQSQLYDTVQITAPNGYSEIEQDWLLSALQAGSLKLKPRLISQDEIAATLGKTAIERGLIAFAIGMLAVIGVMLWFYRSVGVLAIFALLLNFVLIFGILILLDATLTLPGLAGLVLTVGMAVDANILIFERIREELEKGKTVLHAAKNGFDRAFVTIFDANLTTFIVAAFLVAFGQGPIKGFGYTLMAGIVCSLFTALYVTRTIMGFALKRGKMKELTLKAMLQNARYDFAGKFKTFAMGSIVAVLLGLAVFTIVGEEKYGLDFNGGASVRMVFDEPVAESEIKSLIGSIKDENGQTKYQKIDVAMIAPEGGKAREVKITLDYQQAEEGEESEDEFAIIEAELEQIFGDRLAAAPVEDVVYDENALSWQARVNFVEPRGNGDELVTAARAAGLKDPVASKLDGAGRAWQVSGQVPADLREGVDAELVSQLRENEDVQLSSRFSETRFIGPRVVADLKASAIEAMLVSLLFILAYIWFRFKELKYGIAATVALVHDVAIALGLTVGFNAIGLIHVPIDLDVIAAFLTIIGYSLNDTIIVFDRIRENIDSASGSYRDIVNRSINQTLSRTILTSGTTAIVIGAVFFCNLGVESPLEGFSFTLFIGIVVGTYSSIFIASPILVWLTDREERRKEARRIRKPVTAS